MHLNPRHKLTALLSLLYLFAFPHLLNAQSPLLGKISMAKGEYLAGEPVYVHFEVTNTGKDAIQYMTADPYLDICSGYQITVLSGEPQPSHGSCGETVAGNCVMESELLAPGETVRQNILLNFAHNVSTPGDYEILALRTMKYAVVTGDATGNLEFKLEQNLRFRVVSGSREVLRAIYQVYVRNLASQDDEIQRDAEIAIVSGAQPWLEDIIVGMLRKSTSREFALLGLKNLNTTRSREELSKIVKDTAPFTPENEGAVKALASMGDKTYYSMILDMAKNQPPDEASSYLQAAAQLGGDDAVPYLKDLLAAKNPAARRSAIVALGNTGSRAAIPPLLDQLKNPDAEISKLASGALAQLTHQRFQTVEEWSKWWDAGGKVARIFGAGECELVSR
jgi:hypothetical protein